MRVHFETTVPAKELPVIQFDSEIQAAMFISLATLGGLVSLRNQPIAADMMLVIDALEADYGPGLLTSANGKSVEFSNKLRDLSKKHGGPG